MLTETTVSKLRDMRLSVMANALKDQLVDAQFQNMAFEDRLGLLSINTYYLKISCRNL